MNLVLISMIPKLVCLNSIHYCPCCHLSSGTSIVTIILGHLLDSVLQTLGDFEYVSTTAEIVYPVAKVIGKSSYPGGNDGNKVAKEIDDTIQVTSPDHVAFTGKFKSGAIASIMLRGGIKTTESRRIFLWEIDGEDGSIRVEGTRLTDSFELQY